MKGIIFDVDGVITISSNQKNKIIVEILKKYYLYNIPWVKEIFEMSLNRVVLLNKIYEIVSFDKDKVLHDINLELSRLESNPIENPNIINFIKNNYKKYLFFTNTSLPHAGLKKVLDSFDISHCFIGFFAGEDGTKEENIISIIDNYDINPEQILFIDDTLGHIHRVKNTWVHTLHFTDSNIDIKKFMESLS